MEEAKAYIETGILELYVLGQLDAREQREVEVMAAKHSAVKAEISAIEIAMEQYAIQHAIQPSSGLDKQIFEKILVPAHEVITPKESVSKTNHEAKIIPLGNDKAASTIKTLRYALVACVGLLVVSVVALYSTHDKLKVANQ